MITCPGSASGMSRAFNSALDTCKIFSWFAGSRNSQTPKAVAANFLIFFRPSGDTTSVRRPFFSGSSSAATAAAFGWGEESQFVRMRCSAVAAINSSLLIDGVAGNGGSCFSGLFVGFFSRFFSVFALSVCFVRAIALFGQCGCSGSSNDALSLLRCFLSFFFFSLLPASINRRKRWLVVNLTRVGTLVRSNGTLSLSLFVVRVVCLRIEFSETEEIPWPGSSWVSYYRAIMFRM